MILSKKQALAICLKLEVIYRGHSFLSKGNHNVHFLLNTMNQNFVVRVENNSQFKNLKREYTFLKKSKSGLGPKVFLFDNSHSIINKDYMIEEYVLGKHPCEKHPTNRFIELMADWFRSLHTITKKTSTLVSLLKMAKPYYKNYMRYRDNISHIEFRRRLEKNVLDSMAILEKNDTIFEKRNIISLLHNDTSCGNIFIQTDQVRLIDWEFVGYGLPEREIVYFFDSYPLSHRQRDLFLQRYGYSCTITGNRRLNLMYIILLLSSIGYSLWQLDILCNKKALKKEITQRMKRLTRDVSLLEKKLKIIS